MTCETDLNKSFMMSPWQLLALTLSNINKCFGEMSSDYWLRLWMELVDFTLQVFLYLLTAGQSLAQNLR